MKYTLFFIAVTFLASCSSPTSGLQTTKSSDSKEMSLGDNEVSQEFALETYLQRTPGVVVNGSSQHATVQVRGVNSFGSNTQPLFIINGTDSGQNYGRVADLLRGVDIKSVEVLKGSDATLYGARGGGGVIVIKTQ